MPGWLWKLGCYMAGRCSARVHGDGLACQLAADHGGEHRHKERGWTCYWF